MEEKLTNENLQTIINVQRKERFAKIDSLINCIIEAIGKHIQNADADFPFHYTEFIFEISSISNSLDQVIISNKIITAIDKSEYPCYPFYYLEKQLKKTNSKKTFYNLSLTLSEWGMFFDMLSSRGLTGEIICENDKSGNVTKNWNETARIIIQVSAPL